MFPPVGRKHAWVVSSFVAATAVKLVPACGYEVGIDDALGRRCPRRTFGNGSSTYVDVVADLAENPRAQSGLSDDIDARVSVEFSRLGSDETRFEREIAEMALAHEVGDETEQAYRRGNALKKRRQLTDAWGRYVASASNVIALPRRASH